MITERELLRKITGTYGTEGFTAENICGADEVLWRYVTTDPDGYYELTFPDGYPTEPEAIEVRITVPLDSTLSSDERLKLLDKHITKLREDLGIEEL